MQWAIRSSFTTIVIWAILLAPGINVDFCSRFVLSQLIIICLGGRYKTWKRRWFLLNDNCLYYFEYTTVLYDPNSVCVISVQPTIHYYNTHSSSQKHVQNFRLLNFKTSNEFTIFHFRTENRKESFRLKICKFVK